MTSLNINGFRSGTVSALSASETVRLVEASVDAVYCTEGNGMEVVWRMSRDRARLIEITLVRNMSRDAEVIVFPIGTDLVAARERHPALDWLWDRVRRDFWARLSPLVRCDMVDR